MNHLRSFGHYYFSHFPSLGSASAIVVPAFQVQPRAVHTMTATTKLRDPNTLSNYNHWRSTHITANFDILFDQKKLAGHVIHKLISTTDAKSCDIILDTSHLDIGVIKVDGQPSKWEYLSPREPLGNPLRICLNRGVELNHIVEVDVRLFVAASLHQPVADSFRLD